VQRYAGALAPRERYIGPEGSSQLTTKRFDHQLEITCYDKRHSFLIDKDDPLQARG
jgi:hypothetical protein